MDANENHSLVPKLPCAIEKSDAGAQCVLSGVVDDPLPLAGKNELPKRRIVILDDTPEMRALQREILEMFYGDLEFVEFENGDDAWQELVRRLPDLLIVDVQHPGMDCEEMLSRLQALKAKLSVLVVGHFPYFDRLQGRLRDWPDLSITLLTVPIAPLSFLKAVEVGLKIQSPVSAAVSLAKEEGTP